MRAPSLLTNTPVRFLFIFITEFLKSIDKKFYKYELANFQKKKKLFYKLFLILLPNFLNSCLKSFYNHFIKLLALFFIHQLYIVINSSNIC